MPNNNPTGTNQYTKNGGKARAVQPGDGQHGGDHQQSSGAVQEDPNNYHDRDKAREAGHKSGKS